MPVTFPAHQGLVIGAKLRWPGLIDGTALCVAAATPDLAYPLGAWLGEHSHTTPGLIVWAIPVALVVTAVVRWRAAAGVFAHLPDLGPLRLRSYRVLGVRRPPWWVTAASAAAGAVSHVVIDSFTHAERWGAELLGLGRRIGASALGAGPTWADVLQYVGHLFGSVAFLAALVTIAARGSLERWYGSGRVREARDVTPSLRERAAFVTITVVPTVVAVVVAFTADVREPIFLPITTLVAALLVAGVTVPAGRRQVRTITSATSAEMTSSATGR